MTPDMMAILGLDNTPFKRGMREAELHSTRGMTSIARSTGIAERQTQAFLKSGMRFLGVGAVVGTVTSTMRAYAESNIDAAVAMERTDSAVQRLKASIGRDLGAAITGTSGDMASMIDDFNDFRDGVAGDLVTFWSFGQKNGREITRLQRENDRSAEDFAGTRRLTTRTRETDAAVVRENAGRFRFADMEDPTRHVERATEALRRQKSIEALASEKNASTRASMREQEDRQHDAVMARITSVEDADRRHIAAARAEADEVYRIGEERAREKQLRLTGSEEEADLLAAQLEAAEKLAHIRADTSRSPERRDRDAAAVRLRLNDEERFIRAAAGRKRFEDSLAFGRERREAEVGRLTLEGRDKESEVLKVRLDYENQIADVMRDQNKTAEQRQVQAEALGEEMKTMLDLTTRNGIEDLERSARDRDGSRSFRSLEAGMGGNAFFRSAVGAMSQGGAVKDEAKERQIRIEGEQLQTLREMRDQLKRGVQGVMG